MRVARLTKQVTATGIQMTSATTTADAIEEGRRLTERDRWIIDILAEHRALTAEQVARLDFPNPDKARHRLVLLYRRGVLARFRRCVRPGSQHWRYTLGLIGEAIHAAQTGAAMPRAANVREKIVRLAESRNLDHLLGVNEFFVSLIHHARHHPGCALDEWWSERRTAASCGTIVRPDGYGQWSEHGRTLGFFLEHDNDTERLSELVAKLDRYAELTRAGVSRPVLFFFSNTTRLHNFARLAHRMRWPAGLTVAAAAADQLGPTLSPADRLWLPLDSDQRTRLIELGGLR